MRLYNLHLCRVVRSKVREGAGAGAGDEYGE